MGGHLTDLISTANDRSGSFRFENPPKNMIENLKDDKKPLLR